MKHDICRLDFSACGTLASQLADNICRAIAGGNLRPGEKLPSIAKMAELCGTSVRVPREAVRQLENEGVLKGRPRSGLIVLGKKRFVWRGSVLFISYGRQSYFYRGVLFKNIAQRLSEDGWRVDFVNLACGEGGTFKQMEPLNRSLQNGHRLVIGAHLDEKVLLMLRKSGVPYFSITGMGGVDNGAAEGLVALSETKAIAEFAEASGKAGVRHALRVTIDDSDEFFAMPFGELRIGTEDMIVRPDTSISRFENSSRFVFEQVVARLTDRKAAKVDLVYFADDSFTAAGLWALEHVGLRIPDDIRVVTFSNRGNRPFFKVPLACIEHDLMGQADRIANCMIDFLNGRKCPHRITCSARFVPGATL